ncbi:MAG: 2-oxoacid:acceptor oxidoreductase subunit alpha [Clostridia bacterium]|nr:2-oxoacid:acceptor oxidoreductase subunit alpha [Clostridia bacterium]
MYYNILIGGAAGQGMDTLASLLEKIIKRQGFHIFTTRDYMSRVRGGHNFIQVRFGNEVLRSHWNELDCIVALNEETLTIHAGRLKSAGLIICDEEIPSLDRRQIRLPLKTVARTIGNSRILGTVALGAVLKSFGIEIEKSKEVIQGIFDSEDIIAQNNSALIEGHKLVKESFSIERQEEQNNILLNGNQAIGLGAIAAGCKFYSAYPMTPSTSIMDYLASKMYKAEIVVEQAEDEIAAVMMAIGASYAGVRAMTGTSGGGFSLMVEALGLSGMMEIPLVIAEIQRPGPVTGLPTRTEQSDLKFVISASQGEFPRMVIALKNLEDAFYQTVRAFNIADKYQIPVIILGDQFLADHTTTVKPFQLDRIENNRYLCSNDYIGEKEYKRYEITENGISPRIIPGKVPGKTVLADSDEHDEYGRITESAEIRTSMCDKRMRKMDYLIGELQEPDFIGNEKCDVLLLAWGSLHGPVSEAVKLLNLEEGNKFGALVFGDIWPLPTVLLKDKATKADKIINIEQNATGQLASVIAEITGIRCSSSFLKYDGRQISSQDIMMYLQEKK